MSRRQARESAFKVLYGLEFNKDDVSEQLEMFFENQIEEELKDNDKQYLIEIVEGVEKNKKTIDENIEKYLKGWKISRISKIDLSILRLAIYELVIRDDIPVGVSINEAVEIAKLYSADDSPSFINGVLGEVAKVK